MSFQLPSINATIRMVSLRTKGRAKKPSTAPTGQPMMKACSQRVTKSARKPIFANVTTARDDEDDECCRQNRKYEPRFAFHARHLGIMVNTALRAGKCNIIEQSLTEILPFSAHVAWGSVVPPRLRRRCRADRARRLWPLLQHGRTRGLAARRRSRLSQFRRGEGGAGTRAHLRDQWSGHLRHGFSDPRFAFGDSGPLGYDDEPLRPPGAIPNGAMPQRWPIQSNALPPPSYPAQSYPPLPPLSASAVLPADALPRDQARGVRADVALCSRRAGARRGRCGIPAGAAAAVRQRASPPAAACCRRRNIRRRMNRRPNAARLPTGAEAHVARSVRRAVR